jgi:hypothetical protein
MVITIIAEPRTGGSHLVESIQKALPNFELAAEPWNGAPNKYTETRDVTNIDWINDYENIIIKEIYEFKRDFEPLIYRSDIVFCIYKENWYSQIQSILYSRNFDEWQWEYKKTDVDANVTDVDVYDMYYSSFKWYKKDFQDFIRKYNFPSISYEKLYYRNGVNEIKNVFGLKDSFQFPIYERHLKDNNGLSVGYEPTPNEPTNLKYLNDKLYLSEQAKTHIMFNFLLEQQELNNKLIKEIEELKNRK